MKGKMMRNRFQESLGELNQYLTEMAQLCTQSVEKAIKALETKDASLANEVINNEGTVNEYERKIQDKALHLVISQQPVASDLRFVSATISMNGDLERIGDQAEEISHLVLQMLDREYRKPDLGSLIKMAEEASGMIEKSVVSFIHRDQDMALEVCAWDDVVDDLFDKVRNEVVSEIQDGSLDAETLMDITMIAKYLERIGDHATNIGEAVYFFLTGKSVSTN